MKNLRIQIRYECPHCEGSGVVQNSLWAEYWKEVQTGIVIDTHENMVKWFDDRGINWEDEPEEEGCPDCDCIGTISKWIPITELLEIVKMEKQLTV